MGTEGKSSIDFPAWSIGLITSVLALGTGAAYLNSGDGSSDGTKAYFPAPQHVTLLTQEEYGRELRVRGPLYDFFGIPPYLGKADSNLENKNNLLRVEEMKRMKKSLDSSLSEYGLEFMVVTVADPVDSGENYMFDQQLDAIQKALVVDAADSWVYSGCYLPWQAYRNRSIKHSEITLLRNEHWHQDEPGLLLFRNEHSIPNEDQKIGATQNVMKKSLLLVYLVGELPTLGIQRDAFQHAMQEIVHLHGKGLTKNQHKNIRIVGPTFTGSAFSLRESIITFRKGEYHYSMDHNNGGSYDRAHRSVNYDDEEQDYILNCPITLISGSATSVNREYFDAINSVDSRTKKLQPSTNRCCKEDANTTATSPKGSFEYLGSTVCGFEETKAAIDDLIGGKPVAWLVESGTTFGNAINNQGMAPKNQVVFRFPLEVSRVRKSFEQKRAIERQQMLALTPLRTSTRLPFDIDEETHDMPPPQTPNMTTPEAELLLVNILKEIQRRRIHFVSIMATDIRDTIFLADEIKQHLPGVQILIPESDLLLSHPEYGESLVGAIAACSYPLNTSAVHASQSIGTPMQLFPSQSSYGVYNAVRIHRLHNCNSLVTCKLNRNFTLECKDDRERHLLGFWDSRPQVWLHKVGVQSFIPLGLPEREPFQINYENRSTQGSDVADLSRKARLENVTGTISIVRSSNLSKACARNLDQPRSLATFFENQFFLIDLIPLFGNLTLGIFGLFAFWPRLVIKSESNLSNKINLWLSVSVIVVWFTAVASHLPQLLAVFTVLIPFAFFVNSSLKSEFLFQRKKEAVVKTEESKSEFTSKNNSAEQRSTPLCNQELVIYRRLGVDYKELPTLYLFSAIAVILMMVIFIALKCWQAELIDQISLTSGVSTILQMILATAAVLVMLFSESDGLIFCNRDAYDKFTTGNNNSLCNSFFWIFILVSSIGIAYFVSIEEAIVGLPNKNSIDQYIFTHSRLMIMVFLFFWAWILMTSISRVTRFLDFIARRKNDINPKVPDSSNDGKVVGVLGIFFSGRPTVFTDSDKAKTSKLDGKSFIFGPFDAPNDDASRALFKEAQFEMYGLQKNYQSLILGSLFFFLCVSCYPLTTGRELQRFAIATVFLSVGFCVWSFWRLERDEWLSKLLGTTPNSIQWDFNLLSFLAKILVPVSLILTIQLVPGSWIWLGHVIGPILHLGR